MNNFRLFPYQGILNYIEDRLKTDRTFEKLVYRYMIKDGTLSGTMICVLLYGKDSEKLR